MKRAFRILAVIGGVAGVAWLAWERIRAVILNQEPAPPRMTPPPQPPQQAEDLTAVKGIGPAYAGRLREAGITTVLELANADVDRVSDILSTSADRAQALIDKARSLALPQ